MTVSLSTVHWTLGAEFELSDLDQRRGLPAGYGWDRRDYTMVNSNGVAVDPTGRLWSHGGEVNTPPVARPSQLADCLREVLAMHPDATVNHRSNLHVHVRVPGLGQHLPSLKRVQRVIHEELREVIDLLEPIQRPMRWEYKLQTEYDGAMRRWRRRRVSHHTFLTPARLARQMAAETVEGFYAAEVPARRSDGAPQWQCQPRVCVNLRQHLETDTVEFRHFPGTLDPLLLQTCAEWCVDFLDWALKGTPGVDTTAVLYQSKYLGRKFPEFPAYDHWRELRYRATCHDGSVPKEKIVANIGRILRGEL